MTKNTRIDVTVDFAKNGCPRGFQTLIALVNNEDLIESQEEAVRHGLRQMCKFLHELAQVAALPAGMREDYAKALAGSQEEWDRFCRRLPAPLWRKWPDPGPRLSLWPEFSIPLRIGDDGRIATPDLSSIETMVGLDTKRIRECRVCWRVYWATRIEKSGGPYGCSTRCNNALRQRDFKARKKP